MMVVAMVLGAPAAMAETAAVAAVAIDAPDGFVGSRAYQVLTLQALADLGIETKDPLPLQQPTPTQAAVAIAREAHVDRLFVLHIAPLQEAALASLEEVALDTEATLHRATLMVESDRDVDRVIARLAEAVVRRQPVTEGQTVESVTEAEAQPFSKRPGEFLFGVGVLAGLVAADTDPVAGVYGVTMRFYYEIEDANFGASISGGGSERGGFFETSVRAHYLFGSGDVSGYLGGGLGILVQGLDAYDSAYGAAFTLSGGVEAFRLHSTRLVAGVDVSLPTFVLDGEAMLDAAGNPRRRADIYPVTPMFMLTVLF
jgi:hypothetical protein